MNEFDDPGHTQDYYVSFDRNLIDSGFVINEIQHSYWGSERSPVTILNSIDRSLCAGVYFRDGAGKADRQVGFVRVVTDYSTFAWICDVVITKEHRGKGLGKFLMSNLMKREEIAHLPCLLRTHDAHALYAKFGFVPIDAMRRLP